MSYLLYSNDFLSFLANSLSEGVEVSLNQKDMPKEFKQMNDYIFGDLSDEEKKELEKERTKQIKFKKQDGNISNPKVDAQIKGEVFTFGNAKLARDVLIINLTSAFTCPSKKFCPIGAKACYAIAMEKLRPNARVRNARNEIMFDMARENPAKWSYIFWFIEQYINKAKKMGIEIHHIRLNEAGDFKTGEDILRFDEFAKKIKEKYGILTHAYTANESLKEYIEKVENMAINASISTIDGKSVYRHFYGVKEKTLNSLPNTSLKEIATPYLEYSKDYGWYYKCPCDIADGATCIDCKVCYYANAGITPNDEMVEKYAVLCKIHGNAANKFDEDRAEAKRKGKKVQKNNIRQMATIARNSEIDANNEYTENLEPNQ